MSKVLPTLRKDLKIDLVIAQSENVSHGKGMNINHMHDLTQLGVDAFSGGNHSLEKRSLIDYISDPSQPVLAPANMPQAEQSWGAKIVKTPKGNVLIASLLGTTFPMLSAEPRNPLKVADAILADTKNESFAARIFNFHGDFSSEKRVAGYYLDGRVSAVIGDHWHVPTADAMVLPNGTAHITDVGMCGTLHSSLGVSKEVIISRWRDGEKVKNDIAEEGPYQFNAVFITIDTKTGLAKKIQQIQKVLEKLS